MGTLAVVALVGRMVLIFSLLLLVPLGFSLVQDDGAEDAFIGATLVTFACGLLMSGLTRRFRRELQPRDGFLLAGLTWFVLPLFGALPLMLASGSGAELRQPLGLVMVGGLLVSQVLTLFTTPVIYLFFDRLAARRARQGVLEAGATS